MYLHKLKNSVKKSNGFNLLEKMVEFNVQRFSYLVNFCCLLWIIFWVFFRYFFLNFFYLFNFFICILHFILCYNLNCSLAIFKEIWNILLEYVVDCLFTLLESFIFTVKIFWANLSQVFFIVLELFLGTGYIKMVEPYLGYCWLWKFLLNIAMKRENTSEFFLFIWCE